MSKELINTGLKNRMFTEEDIKKYCIEKDKGIIATFIKNGVFTDKEVKEYYLENFSHETIKTL